MKFIFNMLILLATSSIVTDVVLDLFKQQRVEVKLQGEDTDESFDTASEDDHDPCGSGEDDEEDRKEKEFYYAAASLVFPDFQSEPVTIRPFFHEQHPASIQVKPLYSPPELV